MGECFFTFSEKEGIEASTNEKQERKLKGSGKRKRLKGKRQQETLEILAIRHIYTWICSMFGCLDEKLLNI